MQGKQIFDEFKEIRESLTAIQVTLAKNTEVLNYFADKVTSQSKKIEQLDHDFTRVSGFFTIAGWVVGIFSTIVTLMTKIKLGSG